MKCDYDVAIVGAGISGLSLCWYLQQANPSLSILLLEATDRCGSWIKTKNVDSFLFECGPRGCRPKGTGIATLELAYQLGLASEIIVADPQAKNRYLWSEGKLQSIPLNPIQALTSSLTRKYIFTLLKEFFKSPQSIEDETIYDFCARRFSPAIATQFFDPMVLGIYAGNICELSIRSCFPSLYKAEQKFGSVTKGLFYSFFYQSKQPRSTFITPNLQATPLFSFQKGMETIIQALTAQITASIKLNSPVQKIISHQDHCQIEVNNEIIRAKKVISTLPAYQLAKVIAFPNEIEDLLLQIPYASVAAINFGYKQKLPLPEGFGYLVPSKEKQPILGAVFDSQVFPSQQIAFNDQTVITVMKSINDEPVTEGFLLEQTLTCLKEHLNIGTLPTTTNITYADKAIPQYTLGNFKRKILFDNYLQKEMPNFDYVGNLFDGVSVNDCIAKAKKYANIFSQQPMYSVK